MALFNSETTENRVLLFEKELVTQANTAVTSSFGTQTSLTGYKEIELECIWRSDNGQNSSVFAKTRDTIANMKARGAEFGGGVLLRAGYYQPAFTGAVQLYIYASIWCDNAVSKIQSGDCGCLSSTAGFKTMCRCYGIK